VLGRFSSLSVAHGAAGIGLLCWAILTALMVLQTTQSQPQALTVLPLALIDQNSLGLPKMENRPTATEGLPDDSAAPSGPAIDDSLAAIQTQLARIERQLNAIPVQSHNTTAVEILHKLAAIQTAIDLQLPVSSADSSAEISRLAWRIEELTAMIHGLSRPVESPISALTAIPTLELVTKLYPLDDLSVADVRPLIEPLLSTDVGLIAGTSEASAAQRAAILVRDRPEVIAVIDQMLAELTATPLKIELQITQETAPGDGLTPVPARFTTGHGQPVRWTGDAMASAPCLEPPWIRMESESEFPTPKPAIPPRLQLSITPRIVRERR